ncbi:hypothetical protein C0993_009703 [Termitomyces sp. T159_Od127]|nr:hypothetical protein C0993_009703 [Termitomyces sp. T159_Od127]
MQAQVTRAEVQSITASQSLAAIQTMLRAGLGCITYLRLESPFSRQERLIKQTQGIYYLKKTLHKENGIFDALQKEYLKSFIFAIYLDHDDPNK